MSAVDDLTQTLHLDAHCGVLLHSAASLRYFTGFTGEGVAYITGSRRVLITDGRFARQAHQQSPGFTVLECSMAVGHTQLLSRLCLTDDVETLRFEDDALPVRQYAFLQDILGDHVSLQGLYHTHHTLRQVKREDEIACVRQACALCDEALSKTLPAFREGVTEKQICAKLNGLMLEMGAEALAFPTAVAFGENAALCHPPPGDRALRRGDVIVVDFGCRVNGYCSDMTRTLSLGETDESLRRAYGVVREAFGAAISALRPGAICADVDRAARDILRGAGYDLPHCLGHALGLEAHETPQLSPVCHQPLQAGMVLAVEPGAYLPFLGGVRLEDTVLITPTGAECLTRANHDLLSL